MQKINLAAVITAIDGKRPVPGEFLNPEYQELSEEKKKKTKINPRVHRDTTLRDCLVQMLSLELPLQGNKEIFWINSLGCLFSDDTKTEVEISDDKAKFLQRIVLDNKHQIKEVDPATGRVITKDSKIFSPTFIRAKVLELIGGKEEE